MNKPELINKLQKRVEMETGYRYSKQSLDSIINPMIDIIMEELNRGGRVNVNNLGIFETKIHKARNFYNIQTGLNEISKPKRVVEFSPSRKFKSSL